MHSVFDLVLLFLQYFALVFTYDSTLYTFATAIKCKGLRAVSLITVCLCVSVYACTCVNVCADVYMCMYTFLLFYYSFNAYLDDTPNKIHDTWLRINFSKLLHTFSCQSDKKKIHDSSHRLRCLIQRHSSWTCRLDERSARIKIV